MSVTVQPWEGHQLPLLAGLGLEPGPPPPRSPVESLPRKFVTPAMAVPREGPRQWTSPLSSQSFQPRVLSWVSLPHWTL